MAICYFSNQVQVSLVFKDVLKSFNNYFRLNRVITMPDVSFGAVLSPFAVIT
ncbi:hypothetical protein SDC9_154217 [bioreactor metagenome]|uniref:Uncharacterized protein n=1 Tax=bioreactor metagenome TaxID=1076179 RepID=A0A645EZP2_9ZZZZ